MAPPWPWPASIAELSPGFRFSPTGRDIIAHFLSPMALWGRVADYAPHDGVAVGVDVFSCGGGHPERIPFPSRNQGEYGKVWGHFFAPRPFGALLLLETAAGFWSRYDVIKTYSDGFGVVIAYRTRFAFYSNDNRLTRWRMKEYMLEKNAMLFRGVAFHPKWKDCVVFKVYREEEITPEPPDNEYYSEEEDDMEEEEEDAVEGQFGGGAQQQ